MSNGYRGISTPSAGPPSTQPVEYDAYGLGGGIVDHIMARSMPLDSTPSMNKMRLEGEAVRLGPGFSALGATAPGSVYNLNRHAWKVGGGTPERRLVRLYNNAGVLELQDYVAAWTSRASAPSFNYVAGYPIVSAGLQNKYFFTRGWNLSIYYWDPVSAIGAVMALTGPAGYYVASFGDRLIVLGDGTDTQKLSWSVDGTPTDFAGTGSGESILVDVRTDPVDDLKAFVGIGHNIGALFRRRSIMRCFETGNVDIAIGATRWIDGIGTEHAQTVQLVDRGVMFLGHDNMVYLLEPSGQLLPVGYNIRKTLQAARDATALTGDSVAFYDSDRQHYWLYDRFGLDIWIFDVGYFRSTGKARWWKEENGLFSSIGATGVSGYFPSGSDVYALQYVNTAGNLSRLGLTFTGTWDSPTLNREQLSNKLATLTNLYVLYESATVPTVEVSGDGGITWTSKTITETIAGSPRIAHVENINTTGYDIRVRLKITDSDECLIHGFHPVLVARGEPTYMP